MIETLKNLKDVLEKIPNEILKNFVVATSEDGKIGVLTTEGENSGEMIENWKRNMDKCPELKEIDSFFKNVAKEEYNNLKEINDRIGEPITSE